jgi:hypothetical protein
MCLLKYVLNCEQQFFTFRSGLARVYYNTDMFKWIGYFRFDVLNVICGLNTCTIIYCKASTVDRFLYYLTPLFHLRMLCIVEWKSGMTMSDAYVKIKIMLPRPM